MSDGLQYVLTVSQRQAKRAELPLGRVGYIGIDLVEDDVSFGFDPSSVPEPVLLARVPELLVGLCRAMLADNRVLRIEAGRSVPSSGRWPKVMREERELSQLQELVDAANAANDRLPYPISIWAIPADREWPASQLISGFKEDPNDHGLLAEIYQAEVVRASLFTSSLSLSVPPLLLERIEEWVRRATASLSIQVIWEE